MNGFSFKNICRALETPPSGGIANMTQAERALFHDGHAEHACYECQDATTLAELEFVDDLIDQSPFFKGVSENFSFCSGDDGFFHGNIVNCCIGCYAQIIQGMALWDDDGRKREIGNLTRALRAKPPVPAQAAINAEHLLAGLIGMNDASSLADEDLQEALYCGTNALRADLDALAG